jgi:hypothetical protein
MIPILTVATKPDARAFEKHFFHLKAEGEGNVGGVSAYRRIGVLECWSVGVLECWRFGSKEGEVKAASCLQSRASRPVHFRLRHRPG